MKSWLKVLLLTTVMLVGAGAQGQNSLWSVLRYIDQGLRLEDPELGRQKRESEREFSEIYEDLKSAYLKSFVVYLRLPFPPKFFASEIDFLRLGAQEAIEVHALPRSLFLGSVRRSAINLIKERLILIDLDLWRQADLTSKQLLVLAEMARFSGIDGMDEEDLRYGLAARLLTYIQTYTLEASQPLKVEMAASMPGAQQAFDGDKTFLSFNFNGEDQARVFVMNAKADSVVGNLCLAKGERPASPNEFDAIYLRFLHGIRSAPDEVAYCQKAIARRSNQRLAIEFSQQSLLAVTCAAQPN